MSSFQAFFLGIVQGVTEFFPISSSGHLILIPKVFGWEKHSLAFDAFLHLGTGLAVLFYFRKDWVKMFNSLFVDLKTNSGSIFRFSISELTTDSRQLLFLVLASVPAGIAGILLSSWIETNLRSPRIVAATLFIVALLMVAADKIGPQILKHLELKSAIIMGSSQALALIPGVSRSGITITTGLFSGLTVQSAARFSFLLATPVVLGAGVWSLFSTGLIGTSYQVLAVGFFSTFFSALIALDFFLGLVDNIGLVPFAVYRVLLALTVVLLFM